MYETKNPHSCIICISEDAVYKNVTGCSLVLELFVDCSSDLYRLFVEALSLVSAELARLESLFVASKAVELSAEARCFTSG